MLDQRRTIADVVREYELIQQTLGNRVRQERIDRGEHEGATTEMREESARLRREGKAPDDGARPAQTKCLGEGAGPVPLLVRLRHEGRGVSRRSGCEGAGASTSAYYGWVSRSPDLATPGGTRHC